VKTGALRDGPVTDVPESLSEEGIQNSAAKVFPPATLLVAMYGATIGKLGVLTRFATTNQACAALLPTSENSELLPYVFYYILSQRRRLKEAGQGGAQPNISQTVLKAWEIPLAPLNEQRRIVAAIEQHFSRLDAAVATLERVKAKLALARASVLKAAVEGRLVPTEAALAKAEGRDYEPAEVLLERILAERRARWEEEAWKKEIAKAQQKVAKARRKAAGNPWKRGDKFEKGEWEGIPEEEYRRYLPKNDKWKLKYKEPLEPEVEGLPELPEGWVFCRIDAVGRVQLGRQRSPKNHQGPYMREYLRVANVFEDRIDLSDVMKMNFTPEEYETYRLHESDILLNEGQSPHLVGRPAMWSGERESMCFTNSLVRFQATRGVVPKYALMVFRAQLAMRRYMKIAKITTNIAHLGAQRFAAVEFPLAPIAEQQRIVAEVDRQLSVLDAVGHLVDTNLARCARLRQAILKRAFEGKLAPQDPDDEPASVLLERIKAQAVKSATGATRHRRTRCG